METQEVKIYEALVTEHPNADRLDVVHIGGYMSIYEKGKIKDGVKVAYIPEDSVVPDILIEHMGLTGKLAGKDKNRVKAIKLRGVLSQGLILPYTQTAHVGADVGGFLGVTKWEPQIPASMSGDVERAACGQFKFEIENIKKYPDVLVGGEAVHVTEKIHGTCCIIGMWDDKPIATSKGLAAKGLSLKFNEDNIKRNHYVKRCGRHLDELVELYERFGNFLILGEIYGAGIQDLKYDLTDAAFVVFGTYHNNEWDTLLSELAGFGFAPTLYVGPYERDIQDTMSSGKSMLANHMREGIVISATPARYEIGLGRVILKSVSEQYLTRKGGTEYN